MHAFTRSFTTINPGVPGFTNERILGFLHDAVLQIRPRFSVEIGSFFGRSAYVISAALPPEGRLLCIDVFSTRFDAAMREQPWMQPCMNRAGPEILAMYSDPNLKSFGDCFDLTVSRFAHMQERIEVLRANSRNLDLSQWPSIDFAYIDGDHEYEGVRNDFLKVAANLRPGGVVIFDDYYDSFPGVQRFINELRDLPDVIFYGQQDHDIGFVIRDPVGVISRI
jgi:predicted O-methyltransferase YrrM